MVFVQPMTQPHPSESSESTPSPKAGEPRERVRTRANDAFPTTVAWLTGRVGQGPRGVDEANRHIMTIYAHPLKVYFLGCSLRWLGEPDDIVQGFFADRLSRPEFLNKWVASQRPLRFWLITGFKHYLMETTRSVQRSRAVASIDAGAGGVGGVGSGTTSVSANDVPDLDTSDQTPYDREVALGLVREATRRAQQSCLKDGLDKHWTVFVRHHVDGLPYERIAPDLGIDRARCAVMARTAATRYKAEVRALVAWEGATEEQIDREIRQLLEVTGS